METQGILTYTLKKKVGRVGVQDGKDLKKYTDIFELWCACDAVPFRCICLSFQLHSFTFFKFNTWISISYSISLAYTVTGITILNKICSFFNKENTNFQVCLLRHVAKKGDALHQHGYFRKKKQFIPASDIVKSSPLLSSYLLVQKTTEIAFFFKTIISYQMAILGFFCFTGFFFTTLFSILLFYYFD